MSDAVVNNTLNTGDAASLQEAWDLTMNDKVRYGDYGVLYNGASPDTNADVFMLNHLFVNTGGAGDFSRNYSCHMWNASYTVDFGFQNGVQSTEIRKFEPLSPLDIDSSGIYGTYGPGEMQFWVLFKALVNSLTAQVRWGSTCSLWDDDADVVASALAACPEMKQDLSCSGGADIWFDSPLCRAGSIPGAIEDLSRNLTLTILSSAMLANETAAEVTVHTSAALYSYNWRNLLLAYAIAVCATAVCAVVGLDALLANGYSAETTFSSILLTTRNADLDDLARGHCLGERPLAKEIGRRRLKYGILRSQAHDVAVKGSHACFGFADDVRELKRGEPCW
ncbi:hypothetical protein SLS64_005204 [Diaporthe eres]|uniref:Uncharacterized protein n=1 Tax=Diaporthe eres TaxID=83184 RepID=A0ABR1P326_DIAER